MNNYKVNVNKIIDGDTVSIDCCIFSNIWIVNEKVRINGIDTPESRSKDLVEKAFGIASKKRLSELMLNVSSLITDSKKDKFGRLLGDFLLNNGVLVSQVLINEFFAVEYFGQSKELVRKKHLENRKKLIENGKVSIPFP